MHVLVVADPPAFVQSVVLICVVAPIGSVHVAAALVVAAVNVAPGGHAAALVVKRLGNVHVVGVEVGVGVPPAFVQSVAVIAEVAPIGSVHVFVVEPYVEPTGHVAGVTAALQVVPLKVVPVGHADVTVVWLALAVLFTVLLVPVTCVIRVAEPVPALATFGNVNLTVVTPEAFVADVQVAGEAT